LKFGIKYWLLVLNAVLIYTTVLSYLQYATKMFEVKYCVSESTAGKLYSVPYSISVCLIIFIGYTLDKIGKRVLFLLCAILLLFSAHFISMLQPAVQHPCTTENASYKELLPLILIGIGFSIYEASIWSCLPYLVNSDKLGTAIGLSYSLMNLSYAIVPTIVA
jgi:MFS family permease